MNLELESTFDAVALDWQRAGQSLPVKLLSAMRRIGRSLEAYLKARHLSGRAPDSLDARTGTLRRAAFHRVEVGLVGRSVLVRVGLDQRKANYGRIHEFGGTIRPRKARKLTIPLKPMLTGKGVARMSAREFMRHPAALRGFVGAFINKRGTAIMGVRDRGGVEPVFALKDSVTLRPVGMLAATLREREAWAHQQLELALIEATKPIT